MQNPLRLLVGAALVISAGLISQPAGAIGLPGTQSVQGAIAADGNVIDKVHCRPGWRHHRYGSDGCYRRYRYYDNYGYYPGYYGYGYGPGFYGPGISLGFGIGPRHHFRRW
jgi:hypothetical protein